MHAGGQYNKYALDKTKKLAEFLMEKGVNIVAGTHEHVVHGGNVEQITNNRIATYSLGNFTGLAGVHLAPVDKFAQYSIAWHVYISKTEKSIKIVKTTYIILKTIADHQKEYGIKTVPLYDLYMNEKEELI